MAMYNQAGDNKPILTEKGNFMKKIILIALLILLFSTVAWNILFPLLGITIALSAGIWAIAFVTINIICIATLLFFIMTGLGIVIVGFLVFAWIVGAIVLFPLLLPLLVPLFILMLIVGWIVKKRRV